MPQYLSTDPSAGTPYGQYSNDFTPRNADGSPITAIDRRPYETGVGTRANGQPTSQPYGGPTANQPSMAQGQMAGPMSYSGPTVSVNAPTDGTHTQVQIPGYGAASGASTAGGSQPSITGPTTDPAQITAWLHWQAQQPGADPILQTPDGINYYLQKIQQTGGLSPSNTSYWQNKSTLASNGGAVGAGGGNPGTGGGFGNFQGGAPYTLPTEAEAMAMPGYQFAFDQGQKAVQTGAAAHGNLLGGGTEKALINYGTGSALQGYSTLANLGLAANNQNYNQALATNQTNFGQNSTIAGLGYNATNSSYS